MAVTREELLKYLGKKTRADLTKIGDDVELFSTGTIDSFAMIDLMQWLQKQTKSRFAGDDMNLENFDTIGRIMKFVEKKQR